MNEFCPIQRSLFCCGREQTQRERRLRAASRITTHILSLICHNLLSTDTSFAELQKWLAALQIAAFRVS